MNDEIERTQKLPKEWEKEIAEFEERYKRLYFKREDFRVLYDAIEALKHELYFASLSSIWVFIEKYLRDKLIKSKIKNISKEDKDYWREYTKQESIIEDGGDKQYGDNFYKICKKLKGEGLLGKEIEIEEIYKTIRIAILHGLYGRLYTWILGLREEGEIGNLKIIKDTSNREKIIGKIMQLSCYVTLKKIIIPLLEDDKSLL